MPNPTSNQGNGVPVVDENNESDFEETPVGIVIPESQTIEAGDTSDTQNTAIETTRSDQLQEEVPTPKQTSLPKITFDVELQYDMISEFEEDDFDDTSQVLFDNTVDNNMRNMLVDLNEDYSEDDESDEEVASGHHFRRSYELRNRPHQDTKVKETQQKNNRNLKRKQPQRNQARTQYERKSSTSQNGHFRSTR